MGRVGKRSPDIAKLNPSKSDSTEAPTKSHAQRLGDALAKSIAAAAEGKPTSLFSIRFGWSGPRRRITGEAIN
jgi:hypothetical protein